MELLAAGGLAAAASLWDESLQLPLHEELWMETGVGQAVDAAGVDTFCCWCWRTARSEMRVNVFTVEPRSGVEQFRNALKHP